MECLRCQMVFRANCGFVACRYLFFYKYRRSLQLIFSNLSLGGVPGNLELAVRYKVVKGMMLIL